jgi:hypothetical protein
MRTTKFRLLSVAAGLLLCALGFVGTAWAQAGATGTVSGVVKDETGAVLPGATVIVTNMETSVSRTLQADREGRYHAPNLPPGPYQIVGSLDGFGSVVRSGITLNVGREAIVDFTLKLGSLTDRVEVVGEAAMVETTSSTTGGLISEEQIKNLPLNGRSYIELATLTPGVLLNDTGGRGNGTGFGAKLTVNGSRYNQNLFTLDGTTMNDQFNQAGGASGNVLGVEAVREFQVQTNSFSAEFGRHTGAVISAVTKSGTNVVRGSLFEFHRNDALDARNFFDVAGEEKSEFTFNQFGGSLGGPLMRDRMFFFMNYEGLRESRQASNRATVPTAFFRSLPMSPAVRPWIDVYPLPNGPLLDENRGDYLTQTTETTREDYAVMRIDQQVTTGQRIFGRYTFNDGEVDDPGALVTGGITATRYQFLTLEHSMVRGSNFLNRLQFGLTRSQMDVFDYLLDGVTLPQTTFTEITNGIASVGISGLSGLGGEDTNPKFHKFNNYQLSNVITWNRGRQNIRIGGTVEFLNYDVTSDFTSMGSYSFDSLDDFRANTPNSFQGVLSGSDTTRLLRQTLFGVFVQDDVRLRNNLTLNIGVRYEPTSSITEKDGQLAQLIDFASPTATLNDTTVVETLVKNPTKRNIAPRIGIAWDPRGDGKMSVRAGAGVFYDLLTVSNPIVQNTALRVPPFFTRFELIERPGFVVDFPNAYFTQAQQGVVSAALEGVQSDPEQSVMYKWNTNVQRELWGKMTLEFGYNGSRGVHLWRQVFTNQRLPILREDGRLFVPATAGLSQPNFGRMRWRISDATSNYHGATIGLTKRPSDGMQFQVSYTWAKSVDDGASALGGGDFTNEAGGSRNTFDKDRGLSPFDIRHSVVSNFNYLLPFAGDRGGVVGLLARGWSIGTLLRLRSGQPFSPSVGFDSARTQFGSRYPDLAPGADPNPVLGGHEKYFDPLAFVLPERGVIGNLERNTLIGPGQATVDLMLAKITPVRGTQLHFRAEAFNLFNRVNLGTPASALFNSNGTRRPEAGRITSTSTPARQFQVGVKLVW